MFKYYFQIRFIVLILISIINLLFAQFVPPPGSPLANHVHPRLFFTHGTLQKIATYINTYEAGNFQTFINTLDGIYQTNPSQKERNFLLLDAKSYSFLCYAIQSGYFNNYSFDYTAAQYADKAYQHGVEIDSQIRSGQMKDDNDLSGILTSSEGGYVNLSLGIIYDWCYSNLTQAEREFLAKTMEYKYDTRNPEVYPGAKTKLDNQVTGRAHSGAVGGLAIWGDPLGNVTAEKAQLMLDMVGEVWVDRIWETGEHVFEEYAGWSEGPDYFLLSHTNIFWFTAAASTALNQTIVNDYKWLRTVPLYCWFSLFPMHVTGGSHVFYRHRNDAIDLLEWSNSGTRGQISGTSALLKSADPNLAGFYKWIIEDSHYPIPENVFNDIRVFWLFDKFLWGIKDISVKTPEQEGIANAYRFGLGDVIIKSELNSESATEIQFFTPKYHIQSHYHQDNGSFNVWKYGTLILDGGCQKSGGGLPKSQSTSTPIYHNVLALYPPGGNPLYAYDMNINESADSFTDPANQPGGANNVGNVIAMDLQNNAFKYVDYDYTRSYKGENYVNRIRRAVIYITDPSAPNYQNEEYLLVYDKAEVDSPDIKRRWLAHFPSRPEIINGNWNPVSSGFWTFNSQNILAVSNTYGDAHGKIFIKLLEPDNIQYRLRGGNDGSNYHWFVDANGTDLTERGPFNDWAAFWVGSYRLEIEDEANSTQSQFLTAMQIGDANTLNSMVSVQKVTANNFVGALINGDRIAFFNTANTPRTAITYTFNSNKTVRHIVTGLFPGAYNLEVNGNSISGINTTVDEKGVLYFEYDGGGEFHLQNSSVKVSDDHSSIIDYNIQQNYPNPFNPKTTIDYQLPETSLVKLEIFNILGQKMRTLVEKKMERGQHQTVWDGMDDEGAPVTSGIYLCRFEANNFQRTIKMLLMK